MALVETVESASSSSSGLSPHHQQRVYKSVKDESGDEEDLRPSMFPAKDERDVVLRKVRSVLNKISSGNFNKLKKRWLLLIPTEPGLLLEVTRLIIQKSIEEPMFMEIYCKLLSSAIGGKTYEVGDRIQNYILSYVYKLLKRLETEMEVCKYERLSDRELRRCRHTKIMIHKFISQLHLENVISTQLILQRIGDLVGNGVIEMVGESEDRIECLIVLIKMSGEKLKFARPEYMERLMRKCKFEQLAICPAFSKRIQFMILDLLDSTSKTNPRESTWQHLGIVMGER